MTKKSPNLVTPIPRRNNEIRDEDIDNDDGIIYPPGYSVARPSDDSNSTPLVSAVLKKSPNLVIPISRRNDQIRDEEVDNDDGIIIYPPEYSVENPIPLDDSNSPPFVTAVLIEERRSRFDPFQPIHPQCNHISYGCLTMVFLVFVGMALLLKTYLPVILTPSISPEPSPSPSFLPTVSRSNPPSMYPSHPPSTSSLPTVIRSNSPSITTEPTPSPSFLPTVEPSPSPSFLPTLTRSNPPSMYPSHPPSDARFPSFSECSKDNECKSSWCGITPSCLNGCCIPEEGMENGSRCNTDVQCTSGYCSEIQICAQLLEAFSGCEENNDCVSGKCEVTPTCVNGCCSPGEGPAIWPDDFKWHRSVIPGGYDCIHIFEPLELENEVNTHFGDNYFCWRKEKTSPGLSFHYANSFDHDTMKCIQIYEPEDHEDTWYDNYLCVPIDSPLNFEFYHDGKPSDRDCIEWAEPSDPNGWNDGSNWLCA